MTTATVTPWPIRPGRKIKIGGLTPFSAADYPGQLAAVIFIQGCPWRCHYCHNPHLLERTAKSPVDWDEVLAWLDTRHGLLDAVVFSGGEALLDPVLPVAMAQVRERGFKIGLHTGGAYPDALQGVLPLVDWVGLDIKTRFADYPAITKLPRSGEPAKRSLEILLKSGVSYECRTTIHASLHSDEQLCEMADELASLGVSTLSLQRFRSEGCSNHALNNVSHAHFPAPNTLEHLSGLFANFSVR